MHYVGPINWHKTNSVVCSMPNINAFLAPLRRSLSNKGALRLQSNNRKVCSIVPVVHERQHWANACWRYTTGGGCAFSRTSTWAVWTKNSTRVRTPWKRSVARVALKTVFRVYWIGVWIESDDVRPSRSCIRSPPRRPKSKRLLKQAALRRPRKLKSLNVILRKES